MKPRSDERLWLTRVETARLVGLSDRQFDAAVVPQIPEESRRGKGRTLRYHAPGVVAAYVQLRLDQAKPPPPDDPMIAFGAADSPALEEYRLYRARQEKIKLAQMQRQSIPVDELKPALGHLAGVLRRTFEVIQRNYGDDAAAQLNRALDEAERGWTELLKPPDEPDADTGTAGLAGEPDQDAPAATPARVRRGRNRRPRRPPQN